MWPEYSLLGLNALRLVKYGPVLGQARHLAHYQVSTTGEKKIVLVTRHQAKKRREKWQHVPLMGKEPELREIKRTERNERLHSDALAAQVMARDKLNQLRHRLQISGFCREVKSYNPPSDVNEKFEQVCKEVFTDANSSNATLDDPALRFKFLVRCHEEFDHEIPNTDLFQMVTVENVKQFYLTPVRGKNNYDHMVQNRSNLPRNLHLIAEPIRFNRETDTFFGGVDAFPNSKLEQVKLKAKLKYPTHKDNFIWPDV